MSPYEALPPQSKPDPDLSGTVEELLEQFDISQHGFLPKDAPLGRLPDPYFAPWESLMDELPHLLSCRTFRKQADQLPVLSTAGVATDAEQRRAYVVLCFLAHAYIWGGDTASDTLPPPISVPLLAISETLDLPPVATYAALNLWNYTLSTRPADTPLPLECITSQHTFTGTLDESWFYSVSIAIESLAAPLIPLMLRALAPFSAKAALPTSNRNYTELTMALQTLTSGIHDLSALLDRMDEHCNPSVFYHRIRPFLAGSKNMGVAGLPNGVFYDQGNGKGEWRQLRGGSNGQSSTVQFLDLVLGVEHRGVGDRKKGGEVTFHEEVRGYMPREHRRFLQWLGEWAPGGARGVVMAAGEKGVGVAECREAFGAATGALAEFRGRHLRMVTRYIVVPARRAAMGGGGGGVRNLASRPSEGKGADGLTGTGGTALLPFLKEARDETTRAGDVVR